MNFRRKINDFAIYCSKMDSKHSTVKRHPILGGYPAVWAHIFALLEVTQRFTLHRVCRNFKSALGSAGAWQFIRVGAFAKQDLISALVRRSEETKLGFRELAFHADLAVTGLWRFVENQPLMTDQLREMTVYSGRRDQHQMTYRWCQEVVWVAHASTLVTLSMSFCCVIWNAKLISCLRGLTRLEMFICDRLTSEYESLTTSHFLFFCLSVACDLAEIAPDECDDALRVLATSLIPGLTSLSIECPRLYRDGANDGLDLRCCQILLTGRNKIEHLNLDGNSFSTDPLPIHCPVLKTLSLRNKSGFTMDRITAASLTRLDVLKRQPALPVLPELPSLRVFVMVSKNAIFCLLLLSLSLFTSPSPGCVSGWIVY
jgi:hypothetical protein